MCKVNKLKILITVKQHAAKDIVKQKNLGRTAEKKNKEKYEIVGQLFFLDA